MPNSPDPKLPSTAKSGPLDGTTGPGNTQPSPLSGQTVLITRAAEQAESLRGPLQHLGACVVVHPAIRILPPTDGTLLNEAIGRIDEYDWVVFVSTNTVRFFLERLKEFRGSLDPLAKLKIAAIGVSTASFLKQHFDIESDLIPPQSNSRSLADSLIGAAGGQKLLIARANRGSPDLANALSQANVKFDVLITYDSHDVESATPSVIEQLKQGEIDWVTVTSGAIARSTVNLFGKFLHNTKLVSISPGTTSVLAELGFAVAAEAKDYNMTGIVEAIKQGG